MEITLIDHARERLLERGATEEEVRQTVRSGTPAPAGAGRQAKERVFPYNATWQGRHFAQKMVRAIYVEERNRLVVLTLYVYYGEWKDT